MNPVVAARRLVLASGLDHRSSRRVTTSKQARAVIGLARELSRLRDIEAIQEAMDEDDVLRSGLRLAYERFAARDRFSERARHRRRTSRHIAMGVVMVLGLAGAGGLAMARQEPGLALEVLSHAPGLLAAGAVCVGALVYAGVYGAMSRLIGAETLPVTDLRFHECAEQVDMAELF